MGTLRWGVIGLDIIADEICVMCFFESFEAIWAWTLMSHTPKNFNSFQIHSQNFSSFNSFKHSSRKC